MPHTIELVVRFSDCDSFSHVNNAVYLTYSEQSRIAYFDDVLGDAINWAERGFILARAETNFIKPLLHKDQTIVQSECYRIGTKSIRVRYKISRRLENGQLEEMANGDTVLVSYNYRTLETMPVPQDWIDALKAFEPGLN